MIEMQPSVVLLLVEAVALLTVAQLVWLVLGWRRRRRVNTAVAALIETVGADAEARAERNGGAIGSSLGTEGEALDAQVKAVERATKIVLQRIVIGWSRNDAASIASLPEALEGLSAQWRELLAAGGQATVAAAPIGETIVQGYETKVEQLTEQNRALEEEIAITRNTMNSMLNEYAAMYQRGDRNDDSTARRLLRGESADTAPPPAMPAPAGDMGEAADAPVAAAATDTVAETTAVATRDNGDDDVTEDDLDALFDAHSVGATAGTEDDDAMLADLDVEDPFEGLDDDVTTAGMEEDEEKAPAATAAG